MVMMAVARQTGQTFSPWLMEVLGGGVNVAEVDIALCMV